MPVSVLELIVSRLDEHNPARRWLRPLMKRSAVALVLQVRAGQLHILMIKRAERKGDPWSGHMAFPGGRMDKTDANGFAVATRETREEVDLTLHTDECIGRLSDVHTRPGQLALGMAVSPFVFHLEREVQLQPNYEVAETVWVPMEFLLDPDNREQMTWEYKGLSFTMPCYRYEGREIWGLSLMMLDELMDMVRADYQALN